MNRHTVRVAVLAALGMGVARAGIPDGPIPELENAVSPQDSAIGIDALVKTRWLEIKKQVHQHSGYSLWTDSHLALVPPRIGEPIAAEQLALHGLKHDLSSTEGRIDAVLSCMVSLGESDPCDLSAVLPVEKALKKSGGVRSTTEPYLDHGLRWHNLVASCPDPVRVGGCSGRLMVDGRTGECQEEDRCKRGRPYGDGRHAVLEGEVRTEAGQAWAQVALEEHASVASFARHLLELMAVGAPTELLTAVTQAQLDEIRHAELALGLARRLGADVQIGELDTSLPPRSDLFEILLAVAEDGCVGETLSAVECAIALEQTGDPEIRAVLEQLVEDEARHAALAWRTLAWGLPKLDVDQRGEVLAVFDADPVGRAPASPEGIGVLGGEEAVAARRWGLIEVIRPALSGLAA